MPLARPLHNKDKGMTNAFIFVLTPIIAVQAYFLYKKFDYYDLTDSQSSSALVFFLTVGIPAGFFMFRIISLPLNASFSDIIPIIMFALAICSGMFILTSFLIPIMANYSPTDYFSDSTPFNILVDVVGFISSILGIISFFMNF